MGPKSVRKGSVREENGDVPSRDSIKSAICYSFKSGQNSGSINHWVKKLRSVYDKVVVVDDQNVENEGTTRKRNQENVGDQDYFFDIFMFYLKLPLAFNEKCKYVNRVLEIASQFAASFLPSSSSSSSNLSDEKEKKKEEKDVSRSDENGGEEEEEDEFLELPYFMNQFLHWLLDHHEVVGSLTRLRICLLVNRLLKLMGENASIDDDLYQKIYTNMQQRLKDKVAEIRSQAVTALERLQDPRQPDCPITSAFIFHLSSDPSPLVRKTVIKCIAATKFTLPHLLKRTRDDDEAVRAEAYKFIGNKIHVKSLAIAQREMILKQGLFDRSSTVVSVVEKDVVPAWLRHSKENIVELLYALNVENSSDPEIASMALNCLFSDLPQKELLKSFQYLNEQRLVPLEKLTAETVVYWKNLAHHFYKDDEQDILLPELTKFCKYVRSFTIENSKKSCDQNDEDDGDTLWTFITKELILMLEFFDLSDEAGRSNLHGLLKDLLLFPRIGVSLISPLITLYGKVEKNHARRVTELAEIISEIRDPLVKSDTVDDLFENSDSEDKDEEQPMDATMVSDVDALHAKKMALAKLKVNMNVLQNEMDTAIEEKNFVQAQEIKLKMESLEIEKNKIQDALAKLMIPVPSSAKKSPVKMNRIEDDDTESNSQEPQSQIIKNDPLLVHKCLEIVYELMKDHKIKTLNASLKTLIDEFILPSIRDMNSTIRQAAIKALGVCSLRSLDDAKKHLVLILQAAHLDVVLVRVTAISVICDLLMFHGLPSFAKNDENSVEDETREEFFSQESTGGDSSHSVVAILIKMLDDDDIEIRTKASEGLCKLLVVGAISSSKLIMRLILLWFNPLTESDGKLCHIIGTFFPLYASLSRSNQECIEEAFSITLEKLFDAPVTSPLARINAEEVAMFFIQLTRDNILQNQNQITEFSIHDSLAFTILNFMCDQPDSARNKILLKALNALNINPINYSKLRELKVLLAKTINLIEEKLIKKSLDKLANNINLWLEKDPNKDKIENKIEEVEPTAAANELASMTINDQDTSLNGSQMGDTTVKRRMLYSQTASSLLGDDDDYQNDSELDISASNDKTPAKKSCSSQDPSDPQTIIKRKIKEGLNVGLDKKRPKRMGSTSSNK